MSLTSYNIQRWDSLSVGGNALVPALYVLPDQTLMAYVQQNNFQVPITISNTNSIYDGLTTIATCQPSQNTAGYRPNFQAITNLIVFKLNYEWEGYPNDLGQITLLIESPQTESSFSQTVEKFVGSGIPFCVIAVVFLFILFFVKIEGRKDYI